MKYSFPIFETKNPKIGIRNRLSGGLGNQLFQIHILRQLSRILNIPNYSRNWDSSHNFSAQSNVILNPQIVFAKSVDFNLRDFEISKASDLIEKFRDVLSCGRNINLSPGILGSIFFDYLIEHPNKIFEKFDHDSEIEAKNSNSRINLGLHFRGKDFEAWNSKSIMPPEYYLNALECMFTFFPDKNHAIKLYTDDPSHSTVENLQKNIKNLKVISNLDIVEDFKELSTSDAIISSPSTYCFWASILGKKKIVVYESNWMNIQRQNNSKFWIDIMNKSEDTLFSKYIEV